jgi:ankyrin repeat protein
MRTSAHKLVEDILEEVQKLSLEESSKYKSAIFLAAKFGNVEFLTILLRSEPDLIWMTDEENRNIFHISVRYRQETVFNLIHETGLFQNMLASTPDKNGNNMLHLAGELAPPERLNIVSGAALRMQRELLWFEVC